MSQLRLSVLMPNFNHGRFLPEALDAILGQSYQPFEVIVIDDASTDNSVEILERFAARHSCIRLVRNEQNMGVMHNVNHLLNLASGDYLLFAAADDVILPGFFE